MKKISKFTSCIAALLGLISLILMLSTPSVYSGKILNNNIVYSGVNGIFGGKGVLINLNATPLAVIAFIILIIAICALVFDSYLVLTNKKTSNYEIAMVHLSAIAFLVAAIFMFCEVRAFANAQGIETNGLNLGAGWIIAGIVAILGAIVACISGALKLMKK